MKKVKAIIKNILFELLEESDIEDNMDLVSVGLDSVLFVETILQLEEKFGIQIPDEKLNFYDMNTINKITNVILTLILQGK